MPVLSVFYSSGRRSIMAARKFSSCEILLFGEHLSPPSVPTSSVSHHIAVDPNQSSSQTVRREIQSDHLSEILHFPAGMRTVQSHMLNFQQHSFRSNSRLSSLLGGRRFENQAPCDHSPQAPRTDSPGDVVEVSPARGKGNGQGLRFSVAINFSLEFTDGTGNPIQHPLDIRNGKYGLPIDSDDRIRRLEPSFRGQ